VALAQRGRDYFRGFTLYEATLKAFRDGGGRLFMAGQDIPDQGAGTTDFVHDYLHITWDGSRRRTTSRPRRTASGER
jgi:hypothetical protein